MSQLDIPSVSVWAKLDNTEQKNLLARPALADSLSLQSAVKQIISDVKTRGDQAVLELTQKFDNATITSLQLEKQLIDSAVERLSTKVIDAINMAYTNIKAFHQAQYPKDISIETQPGVICEQKHAALEAVGLYIPGGSAPLPSTVLMLGVSAQVAGCERVILCTPPSSNQGIADEILYAASLCGIDEVFLCGGAQAIAAMAFGTQTIPKVDKIFGPGNSFVTEAKQQVSQVADGAAIDMPAGPSEVLVLADKSADASFVAADLLSQAEHGTDSQSILVADCPVLIENVQRELATQLQSLSRRDIAKQSIANSRLILTDTLEQSIEVSNLYAAEHLIIQTNDAELVATKVKHAGSIFVGAFSPESAGDYASGTNHVLPTYGYARNYSSLGLLDFMRRFTVQTLSKEGLHNIADAIIDLANAEGLDAHAKAVSIRVAKAKTQSDEALS